MRTFFMSFKVKLRQKFVRTQDCEILQGISLTMSSVTTSTQLPNDQGRANGFILIKILMG